MYEMRVTGALGQGRRRLGGVPVGGDAEREVSAVATETRERGEACSGVKLRTMARTAERAGSGHAPRTACRERCGSAGARAVGSHKRLRRHG
jgi:hypothetical protein